MAKVVFVVGRSGHRGLKCGQGGFCCRQVMAQRVEVWPKWFLHSMVAV